MSNLTASLVKELREKTGSGMKRKQANKRHILTKMSTKSKRQLRGTTSLADGDEKLVKRMFRERS